ncbi:MAG TPA: glutamine amidotransferase [Bryobacteraceae bacterium]|nr:glutamine amidotransferase [Bryobacteraceae bacterium]
MRKAIAITHVAFEDLGTMEAGLSDAGYRIEIVNACTCDLQKIGLSQPDLLVILGGPIGVYEAETYRFLDTELDLIRSRIATKEPTIGICLGAQLIAAAAGGSVYPGAQGKEIGWAPIHSGPDAGLYPEFAEFLAQDIHVLHWHGDTFDLPPGSRHLARTNAYANQAFAIGQHTLGLQFHPEVTAHGLEAWYVGHACELSSAGVCIQDLRHESEIYGFPLEEAAQRFWRKWLARL